MRNRAILAAVAGGGVVNGLHLDQVPPWRQMLFAVLAVAAYLHGRHLPERRDWLLLAVAATAAAILVVPDFWAGVGALMALGVFVVLPWLAGRLRGQQAELVLVSRQQVAQLKREQELIEESARLRERARIATDMHDSLGHELALIALRAGALELALDMTEPNREAAAQLRVCAVTAADRLRHTVGVLRETGAVPAIVTTVAGETMQRRPTEPPDEAVEVLVDRARDAGMAVNFHYNGKLDVLPSPVGRIVHRVVQESLTNAARHAPGADVLVRIEQTIETVMVTVSNTRPRTTVRPSGDGSGLAGLRERVRLLGGTLRAGPQCGGFAVMAWLPCNPDGNRQQGQHREESRHDGSDQEESEGSP